MHSTETEPSNPYSPPAVRAVEHVERDSAASEDSARRVFIAWELLRLLYNAVLVCLVLFFAAVTPLVDLTDADIWANLIVCAFLANLFFCVGSVAEGYLSLLGLRRTTVRWLLFIAGTAFSCLLAWAVLVLYPNFGE